MRRLMEALPIGALAGIAACGSFSHIARLAERSGQTGWMAYSVAVCIDLLAVVASLEIRRDRRLGRSSTVPTLVLAGAIVLTLGANLAEAQRTPWGFIVAGVPATAFLLAVALIERRGGEGYLVVSTSADLGGRDVEKGYSLTSTPGGDQQVEPEQEFVTSIGDVTTEAPEESLSAEPEPAPEPVKKAPKKARQPASPKPPKSLAELLILAQRADQEHRQQHGRRISRDKLRTVLGVSTGTASDVLRELRTA